MKRYMDDPHAARYLKLDLSFFENLVHLYEFKPGASYVNEAEWLVRLWTEEELDELKARIMAAPPYRVDIDDLVYRSYD